MQKFYNLTPEILYNEGIAGIPVVLKPQPLPRTASAAAGHPPEQLVSNTTVSQYTQQELHASW